MNKEENERKEERKGENMLTFVYNTQQWFQSECMNHGFGWHIA